MKRTLLKSLALAAATWALAHGAALAQDKPAEL